MDGHTLRLAAPGFLEWRVWDDGCVVFNAATGQTHYLDNFTSYLLRLIEADPLTVDDLTETVSVGLGRERSAQIEAQIAGALRNFETLALLESAR